MSQPSAGPGQAGQPGRAGEAMKTHVSLFTGIGGFDLACDWLGIDTVLQAECDPYCLKVLEKHWPNVRRIHDVREVNALAYTEARENHRRNRGELAEAQGRGRSGNTAVDVGGQDSPFILTGGFPCQPFSCAGKRKGKADDRFLWPEMLRVIQELKPLYVVAENVRGLLSIESGMVFEHCLADLEAAGYEVWPVVIPACAVNAPHRRDRVWIVAHAQYAEAARQRGYGGAGLSEPESTGLGAGGERSNVADAACQFRTWSEPAGNRRGEPEGTARNASGDCGDAPHSRYPRPSRAGVDPQHGGEVGFSGDDRGEDGGDATVAGTPKVGEVHAVGKDTGRNSGGDWWAVEPNVGGTSDGLPGGLDRCWSEGWEDGTPRVATGVKSRVDRLKCLGNAIVPAVAFEVIRAMVKADQV